MSGPSTVSPRCHHKIDIAVASLDPILSAFSHNQSVKISEALTILPTISCPNDAVSPDPRGLMTQGFSHDSEQPQHRYLLNIFIEFKLNILTL